MEGERKEKEEGGRTGKAGIIQRLWEGGSSWQLIVSIYWMGPISVKSLQATDSRGLSMAVLPPHIQPTCFSGGSQPWKILNWFSNVNMGIRVEILHGYLPDVAQIPFLGQDGAVVVLEELLIWQQAHPLHRVLSTHTVLPVLKKYGFMWKDLSPHPQTTANSTESSDEPTICALTSYNHLHCITDNSIAKLNLSMAVWERIHTFMIIPWSFRNESHLPPSVLFAVTLYHITWGWDMSGWLSGRC